MPRISSPNPDMDVIPVPGMPRYDHPIDARPNPRPIAMAFQITSPFNRWRCLLPHALILHVNPSNLQETNTQKKEVFQTEGGWVEQHWGHDLTELSAEGSTGAFMNIRTGLTSVLRQRTIAWDRFRDLHDLFRNNGSLYDPNGNIVLQGQVLLMFDRGAFFGGFRSFSFDETADSPFAFSVNWTFKVEHAIYHINAARAPFGASAPVFQNANVATNDARRSAAQQNAGVLQAIADQDFAKQVAAAGTGSGT